MRVAAKIGWGAGLLIALMIAVLAFDLTLVSRLTDIAYDLSTLSIRSARPVLVGDRELGKIAELTKAYGTGFDPRFPERIREIEQDFDKTLDNLEALAVTAENKEQVALLRERWRRYRLRSAFDHQAIAEFSPQEQALWESRQLGEIAALRDQLDEVIGTLSERIEERVARSARVSSLAKRVSWGVVAVTVLLGVLILGLTARAITRPLSRLTGATLAVADGKFFYQLPESGADEFSLLASSFNEMVARLGELDQMKRDFLSHVSHELRTPLVAMQETNELLLEGLPGPLTEKQRRLLELNIQGSRRLSSMISKLLDLSRMENGALEYDLRKNDLVELARDSVEELEARARDRSITLACEAEVDSLEIECDRDRMQQVLVNLLENAIKFSPDGERIRVTVGLASSKAVVPNRLADAKMLRQLGGRAALVRVIDRGSGVPDADKQRIFEKFQQLSRGQRAEEVGIGLGLAICREIVEAHRGVVWVEDNDGRGSRFSVLIPARPSAVFRKRSKDELTTAKLAGSVGSRAGRRDIVQL